MKKFFSVFLFLSISLWAGSTQETQPISKIDRILVEKEKRLMSVFCKQKLLKTYKISLGGNPIGHKVQEGDQKTPEGIYRISAKYPQSQYHRGLYISYPNDQDRKTARKIGLSPGGQILVHGLGKEFGWIGKLHIKSDWTLGCVAVTNEEIEEIFNATVVGTPIEIVP